MENLINSSKYLVVSRKRGEELRGDEKLRVSRYELQESYEIRD